MLEEIEMTLEAGLAKTNQNRLIALYRAVFGSYAGLDMNCNCRFDDAFRLLTIHMKKLKKGVAEPMPKPSFRIAGPLQRWRIKPGSESFVIGTTKRGAITAENATDDLIDYAVSLSKEYLTFFERI